jgi:hypothetical protein
LLGIVELFEKIDDEEPILTVFSVSGEHLQSFSYVYFVRTVSQPNIDAVLEKAYLFQMTRLGFAE